MTDPGLFSTIVTLLAVLVAMFKDEFWRWLRRPKLELSLCIPTSADRIDVELPTDQNWSGGRKWSGQCYFYRLWVKNTGQSRAEKVQVFLSKVSAIRGESRETVTHIVPMNLRWTHGDFYRPEVFADGISPAMSKLCDFVSICDPANPTARLPGVSESHVTADLWTEAFPLTKANRLPPGRYRFGLKVAAGNCKPIEKHVELSIRGPWYTLPDLMLSDGVSMRMVD
jgi:hypothetical protein